MNISQLSTGLKLISGSTYGKRKEREPAKGVLRLSFLFQATPETIVWYHVTVEFKLDYVFIRNVNTIDANEEFRLFILVNSRCFVD